MPSLIAILFIAGVVFGARDAMAQRESGPLGATVRLSMSTGGSQSGELLAARRDSLWLLKHQLIHGIALPDVSRVNVRGKGIGRGGILLWTVIGGGVTGGALTAACSSVAEGCGGVFAGTMLAWAIVGGVAAVLTQSPHRWVDASPEALAPYSRFPQGLPPQFTP